jgi:hypothetical protein
MEIYNSYIYKKYGSCVWRYYVEVLLYTRCFIIPIVSSLNHKDNPTHASRTDIKPMLQMTMSQTSTLQTLTSQVSMLKKPTLKTLTLQTPTTQASMLQTPISTLQMSPTAYYRQLRCKRYLVEDFFGKLNFYSPIFYIPSVGVPVRSKLKKLFRISIPHSRKPPIIFMIFTSTYIRRF